MHEDLPAGLRLPQIEGFFRVAAAGGYQRAVREHRLEVTPAALHAQVRKLEQSLGCRLLEAGPGRRMMPTPEGRELLAFAAPFLERLPGLLRGLTAGESTRLRIGTEALYLAPLLAPALAELAARHPLATSQIEVGDAPTLAAHLVEGQLDLVLGHVPRAPADCERLLLTHLDLALLLPVQHELARAETFPALKALEGAPAVLFPEGTEARALIDHALHEHGLSLRVVAECDSTQAIAELVGSGLGLGFVPTLPGASHAWSGVATRAVPTELAPEAARPPVHLLRRRTASPLLHALVELIEQQAAS